MKNKVLIIVTLVAILFMAPSMYTNAQRNKKKAETEEKGFAWFNITFKGKAGHGSLASKESANNEMTKFVQKVFNLKLHAEPSALSQNTRMQSGFPWIRPGCGVSLTR